MFKRVIVATVIMFFQQWTGINAILYCESFAPSRYRQHETDPSLDAPQIFRQLGLSGNTITLLATGVVGVVMFLATIPAILYVDKLGRKPVLIVGAIGMAISHLVVAGIAGSFEDSWPEHRGAGWAAVVMVWLFVIHFGYVIFTGMTSNDSVLIKNSYSWGPCAWIVIAEIWPLSNRAYGIALGASSNWMNNFIIGQVTPDMLESMRYGTYIFFGILTLGGAFFVWKFVPETKNLSLEEMDILFGSAGIAARDKEIMDEVNREVGLTYLTGVGADARSSEEKVSVVEKS